MKRTITVALAGNPNSGKTTIFNNITGARQHVGNYPGVTVEKKEGRRRHGDVDMRVVDLPGTYSLSAYSLEELVTRNFIIDEQPDVVVDILDASNLERNLYLATQLMELRAPLVLALNMTDVARDRGIEFDIERLSKLLGAPVVPMVGRTNMGTEDLLDAILSVASGEEELTRQAQSRRRRIDFGADIETELAAIRSLIEEKDELTASFDPRWLAIKLLEHDEEAMRVVTDFAIRDRVRQAATHVEQIYGDFPEIVIADRRYGFISGACQEAVRNTVESRHSLSDQVDMVLANRVIGLPIFFALMYLVFELTFTLGDPLMRVLESTFGWMGATISSWWPEGSDSVLRSLLVDGIIGGVGGVVVFLPNILLLFIGIAFLEDTGYMARAAFIMDRVMHRFGLHGKSFIPMLIGFGCSVPAIMATRTLDNQRDRITTMLVIPLMSCGARLPIYALIIPAFFGSQLHAPMLMLIYLIGILLAVLAAKLLRSTIFKGQSTPLVMELPPYRMPTLRAVGIHMWERAWLYLKKAGTIILGISIVLWALTSYPKLDEPSRNYEQARAAATEQYEAGVRALNPALGLPADSDKMLTALRSDVAPDSTVPTELAAFILALRKSDALHADFARVAGRTGEQTTEILMLRHDRDAALRGIEDVFPSIYPVVSEYQAQVRGPYDRVIETIERMQRNEEVRHTVAGRIGIALEPLLTPMGFDWRLGTAMIGAFAAKEVFVAQLGIVFSVGESAEGSNTLRQRLRQNYTPLIGFCIMLFMLIATPCMATVAVTKRESNSWKWALLQLGGLTAFAWFLTTVVYQIGKFAGIGVM